MAKKKKTVSTSPGSKSSGRAAPDPASDPMSRCVILCQEQRWREALALLMQVQETARKRKDKALFKTLAAARGKIEFSLRRQMAAGLIEEARMLLKKEFLLDVAEE